MSFGIYIHSPWCSLRCSYCAFTVYVDKNPPFEEWKQGIIANWLWNSNYMQVETTIPKSIYFGGGTPSLLPISTIEDILDVLPHDSNTEITIEMNPEDITSETLYRYHQLGINRLSVGIQTFHPKHAKLLRRSHTVEQAHQILQTIQQSPIKNWSFDLIFGLPDQSLADLQYDLDFIKTIQPPHVSLYGLTYEKGTPLTRAAKRNKIIPLDEDIWEQQLDCITQTLVEQGYRRYEISNFSKHGFEARHNEHTWKGGFYVGLGPSAHGYLPDFNRTRYDSDYQKWLQQTVPHLEQSSLEQRMMDLILTQIRHIDGISLKTIEKLGYQCNMRQLQPYIDHNLLLYESNTRIKLGSQGWNVVDSLTLHIIEATHPITK